MYIRDIQLDGDLDGVLCVAYLYHAHPPSWPKSKQNTSRTLGRNEQTATKQVLQEKHFFHNKSLGIWRWFLRSIASWFLNFTGYTTSRFCFFFALLCGHQCFSYGTRPAVAIVREGKSLLMLQNIEKFSLASFISFSTQIYDSSCVYIYNNIDSMVLYIYIHTSYRI